MKSSASEPTHVYFPPGPNKGGRPSGCSTEVMECIAAYLDSHDNFTQQQVTDHIRRTLRITVPRPTVCRWLQRIKGRSAGSSLCRRTSNESPAPGAHCVLQLGPVVVSSPVNLSMFDDSLELSQFLRQGGLPLLAGLQAS